MFTDKHNPLVKCDKIQKLINFLLPKKKKKDK